MSTWTPISKIPEDWRDGRGLILANYGDDNSYPGYWEKRPNHWDEIGWAEEDARAGLYFSRHPAHPDICRDFPVPPATPEGDHDAT